MDEEITFTNSSGERLAALLSKPDAPNGKGVLLLHCFTCTKHHRIMRNLSEALTNRGFMVLRYDVSGNGESEGKLEDATYTKMIGETKAAAALLHKKGVNRIGVGGHSM